MLRRKEWGGVTRASMLIGSLSAAAFVFSLTATATVAQPAQSALQPGKRVTKTIFKLAPAKLRTRADMEAFQAAHPSLGLLKAAPRPLIPMGRKAYEAAKRQAAAFIGAKPMPFGANVPPPTAPTTIVKQFLGPKHADPSNGWFPPDSNGAIGGGYLVAPVNASFNVYNRKGTALLNVDLTAFFGAPAQTFDPRVVYDPVWKRWVVAASEFASGSTGGCFDLAISKTANPTGSYWIYQHICPLAAGSIWDYPMLGMSQDAILFTGNNFDSSEVYHGALMASFAKAVLYNGGGFSVPLFTFPTTTGTLTPPIVRDSNANAFFLARDADAAHLDVYKATNLSNAFQTTVSPVVQIAASGLAVPPSAPQPGTTEVLDTLDGRFQSPSSQYGNSLWNVHTGTVGSFPAPWYYQIDTAANSIIHSGDFFASSTSYDFNPSVAVNTNDDAIFTWSATDPSAGLNAQVRFSGRQSADGGVTAGTVVFQSSTALTGNKQGSVQRWGDYSSTFLDSSSTCGTRAAIFNEQIINANNWGVRVGIVGFC